MITNAQEAPQPERHADALGSLLNDARLQPLLVFAGALVLGFVFSRVARTPDPRGMTSPPGGEP